jgi:hypothetical protein
MLGDVAIDQLADSRCGARLVPYRQGIVPLVDFALELLGPFSRGRYRPDRPAPNCQLACATVDFIGKDERTRAGGHYSQAEAHHLIIDHDDALRTGFKCLCVSFGEMRFRRP